jgi:hypothetical protein
VRGLAGGLKPGSPNVDGDLDVVVDVDLDGDGDVNLAAERRR